MARKTAMAAIAVATLGIITAGVGMMLAMHTAKMSRVGGLMPWGLRINTYAFWVKGRKDKNFHGENFPFKFKDGQVVSLLKWADEYACQPFPDWVLDFCSAWTSAAWGGIVLGICWGHLVFLKILGCVCLLRYTFAKASSTLYTFAVVIWSFSSVIWIGGIVIYYVMAIIPLNDADQGFTTIIASPTSGAGASSGFLVITFTGLLQLPELMLVACCKNQFGEDYNELVKLGKEYGTFDEYGDYYPDDPYYGPDSYDYPDPYYGPDSHYGPDPYYGPPPGGSYEGEPDAVVYAGFIPAGPTGIQQGEPDAVVYAGFRPAGPTGIQEVPVQQGVITVGSAPPGALGQPMMM